MYCTQVSAKTYIRKWQHMYQDYYISYSSEQILIKRVKQYYPSATELWEYHLPQISTTSIFSADLAHKEVHL